MERVEASDYHDLVRVRDPDLSPGGDRVAFVREVPTDDETYEATVHVVPVGGDEPRRFTAEGGEDAEPRYSPSGDRLAFVSTRGVGEARPQLWVMPTDGGEARRVTDVAGGVSSIAWSPDGTRIAFAQEATPEERAEGHDLDASDAGDGGYEREAPDPRVIDRLVYRSEERYFDGARTHVYLADLGSDAVSRLTDGDYDFVAPEWGDASTLYYAVKRGDDPDDHTRHDVVAHDLDAGEAETVTETTAWAVWLAATGDGRVAFPHRPEARGTLAQVDVHVYDRDEGETHAPTERLDRTVNGGVEWGPDDEELFLAVPDEGADAMVRVPWDGHGDDRRTVVHDGRLDGFSVGESAVGYVLSEWDHPGDVFASTLGGAEGNRLTRLNAGYLDERAVPQPEEVRFESEDGVTVQGWVLTPPDFDPEGTYPLAVEVHGGPHAMWTTSGTMWHEFQTLAARGYVVFWCNPRGSVGYGEAFQSAIEGAWGEVTATDVLAGVDRVVEREYVDDSNVFLAGGSFGGYMTAWLVGHTDRFSAAVAQRGVYDLAGFYGGTDGAFKLIEWEFGTTPWGDPGRLHDASPLSYAHEVETPTLVVHAEDDYRVPVSEAEALFRYLRKGDADTRFVRYPDEGHELSRSGDPGHVVDRVERIARWFDGYSDHHDVPPAPERGDGGLSTGKGER